MLPGTLSDSLSDMSSGPCPGGQPPPGFATKPSLRSQVPSPEALAVGSTLAPRVDPQEVSDRSKVAIRCGFTDVLTLGGWHPNHRLKQESLDFLTILSPQKTWFASRFPLKPSRNVEQAFNCLPNSGICQASACGCMTIQSDYLHL